MTGNRVPSESLSSQKRMQGWQLLLPALFIFSVLLQFSAIQIQAADAQNPFAKPKKKYNNDNEFVPETLKTPPDLPYLPPYSGGSPSYGSMLCFKRKPDGPGYSVTFHTKDPADDVVAFYRQAFKQNKWDPQKNADSTKIVSGVRRGAVATVTVMKPNMAGYKTQVYIVYKISGKLQ